MTRATIATTERLVLRRFAADEAALLARLHVDPRVMRYAGGVRTEEQSHEVFAELIAYYAANPGLGIWATIERATGACIGLHLINHIRGESDIQVGYLLYPEFWGRGYATEGARAALRYAYGELGLPRVVAITNRENVESQRVLEKIGLRREGDRSLSHPSYAASNPLAWFVSERDEWLSRG